MSVHDSSEERWKLHTYSDAGRSRIGGGYRLSRPCDSDCGGNIDCSSVINVCSGSVDNGIGDSRDICECGAGHALIVVATVMF